MSAFDLLRDEYRRRAAELVRAGTLSAAREGTLFHQPIYGYRRHPSVRSRHVVVPDRAEVVGSLFEMVADGVPPSRVAVALSARSPSPAWCRLEARGAAPLSWTPWTTAEVRSIARHQLYAGAVVYGRFKTVRERDGRVVRTLREPTDVIVIVVPAYRIVDAELASRARAALACRSSASHRRRAGAGGAAP